MHLITLSFDDGFRKSCIEVARIYEQFGLKACFNVMATGIMVSDKYGNVTKGDFALWNELAARGHEVMPHGYRHADKSALSFAEGRDLILQSLDVFEENLTGFRRRSAVFNFPYNRTTPELVAWLPTVVRAFRGGFSDCGLNPPPSAQTKAIRTTGFGPENCEAHLDGCIEKLLAQPDGWLVYNTHGLDEEGWGPIGADYLTRLLDRLLKRPDVSLIPTAVALHTTNN